VPLTFRNLDDLIRGGESRFTQDSPVLPDVWIAYSQAPEKPIDLLLTPFAGKTAAMLAATVTTNLRDRAGIEPDAAEVAYNEAYAVARVTFEELLTVVLPLSPWWHDRIAPALRGAGDEQSQAPHLHWLVQVAARILGPPDEEQSVDEERALGLLRGAQKPPRRPLLWRVDRNREAKLALHYSRRAVKADAVLRLFDVECHNLCWAVVDSGIDATHPAFRKRDADENLLPEPPFSPRGDGTFENRTRIARTYDFTKLRLHLSNPNAPVPEHVSEDERRRVTELRRRLAAGRDLDWSALEPLIRVPHEPGEDRYTQPPHHHGTHVAGILTADWRANKDRGMPEADSVVGIARGLELYDLRTMDENGRGEEFAIIAALQFIRYLNSHSDKPIVHGVNLSVSIDHDVANYACGRTPICDECERLVGSGVVVVAAAGNTGYTRYELLSGATDPGFRSVSITDPGNAELVITVGATHRSLPHQYGVSYFSSRGPTGDGRRKPDLVAPGEKIKSVVPGGMTESLDGTSMAAPHVSGAAALLMARYEELVGRPADIKRILCESATDLGREHYFQGGGMLDILRALQAV
jgi:serine protease AprX